MRTQHRRPTLSDFPYKPLSAALALALAPAAAQAAVATVNDTSDVSSFDSELFTGTLRGAIDYFNSTCSGSDSIVFDKVYTSAAPFVTQPSTPLPTISCDSLTIDGGGTRDDAASRVQIDGSSPGSGFPYGLDWGLNASPTYGGAVTVTGLAVRNIGNGAGITGDIVASGDIVTGSNTGISTSWGTIDNNRVSGNGTGIDADFSNQQVTNNIVYDNSTGIFAGGFGGQIAFNSIGLNPSNSLSPGNDTGLEVAGLVYNIHDNVISHNDIGVYFNEDEASTLFSNYIGTDPTGTVARTNRIGVLLDFTYGTAIGTVGQGNVIVAPATGTAVDVEDNTNTITIAGNNINTDVTGSSLLGGGEGVVANCSSDIVVDTNLIATNGRNGIDFGGVQGNGRIDINSNTIGTIGAVLNGVSLHDAACSIPGGLSAARAKFLTSNQTSSILVQQNQVTGASQNGIVIDGASGTQITYGNTITGNARYGVEILSGTGNVILDSFVYGNAGTLGAGAKNIDLDYPGGPRPNHAIDVDVSQVPNHGQNYPDQIVVQYRADFDETTISFSLDSLAGVYRIDLFDNNPATTVPGGNVQIGNTFLTITTSGVPASGSYTVSGRHDSISLTATSTDGSGTYIETSEFSPVDNSVLTPGVTVTPTAVNFGNVPVDTTSPLRHVTVGSTGTDTYVIGAIGDTTCYGGTICYGGSFTCSTTCDEGEGYAPGQSCSFSATFHPTFTGTVSQTIQLCDNAVNSPRNIVLTGTGVVPPPIELSPDSFDFGSVPVGKVSPPETFTISNPGLASLNLSAISTSLDFVTSNITCGDQLASGDSCTVDVAFSPETTTHLVGTLSVSASGGVALSTTKSGRRKIVSDVSGPSGGTAVAELTGTGIEQAAIDIPSQLDFGTYSPGAAAVTRNVNLHNSGNAAVTFESVTVTGPFTMANGCGATLAPGASCSITLTFSEQPLGSYTGTLQIMTDAIGGSGSVQLTAQTVAVPEPLLRVTPASIGFGNRMFGTTQGTQRVTITNIGGVDVLLSPTTINGPDFIVASTSCGPTLSPSSTCFADVAFRPVGFGQRHAQLSVNSNAVNGPNHVTLAGTGCRPFSAGVPGGSASSCSP